MKEGFIIYVIAPIDKYIHYKENYLEVIHIPLKKLSRDSINPIKDILLMLELKKIYKKLNPDIVLHYTVKPNIYGGIAAKLSSTPSIAVVIGLGYAFIHNGYVKIITELLYKLTSSFHKKMIFENIDDRELFEKTKLIKKGLGISINGCGVDTQYFQKTNVKSNHSKKIFTFIGRLLYDKGVKEFVQAAKIIKQQYTDTEFWLLGDIDKQNPATVKNDDLVQWVKEKTVIYHGSTNDVRPYINNSDCIVLPSYREGLSRVLMEAASMSMPIITSDAAGCREVVDEGLNGYLVPIKDVTALSIAMEKIVRHSSQEIEKMGKHSRQKILKEFDDNLIAREIYAVINDVLK